MLLPFKSKTRWMLALCLGSTLPLAAQEPNPDNGPILEPTAAQRPNSGFRRADDPQFQPVAPSQAPQQITLPAGTWISVRVNQPLSSERNQPGDSFSATLDQPLIADGIVIARRGQTLGGRVAEAVKAGRVKGTSRLSIEITELSLVDGQQIPVRAQIVDSAAGTSRGRDAAAIGTTTGIGAAIGAAAGGGFGAGMGAIAGAGAAAIGVLATKGRGTEIYPEEQITFRTLAPVTISTGRSEQAFQPVRQDDYSPVQLQQRISRPNLNQAPFSNFYGGGYGFGPAYYNPFFYGPSFGFYTAPRFYGGFRGGYRGGYGRRR